MVGSGDWYISINLKLYQFEKLSFLVDCILSVI